MKYSLAIALVSATLLSAPALAQTAPSPAVSVTGEATVSVAPDQAQIDGGVTSDARTAREASEANNAAMNKVMQALKGAGIEERDTQTSRLSLQPQYAPNRTGTSPITGYRASNRVTIRLRDVTKVANVIDVLAGAGANDIGGINFTVSQPSKHLDEAREKAVADARRKAEIYAKAAGVTLGEPLSISEEGAPAPLFRGKMAAPMAAGAPVAQGEETLSVTVNVSWAIKSKAQ
ncbi:MAG: SIMPL domain-containing protein [Bradyrhizobium sp.]|nr:SIMPL domain-containing protein [Bradyrhizobium sp.]